ncbi:hypothetical protein LJ737_16935 [Hymenobacter sp. 15J16-1T3B]|uniref:hypothetical protein n=1 Tax=Hymenobacter sp. 15J16-1T3B TaxID=2886941 RepID=UPI001D11BD1E|nr:hypothetical protein [Hymenobacter sp. 15J16-1T3B]MCC3158931.1 hypothetical protein [Hymenobacter sp. 15J16-1T3B]
MDDHLHDAAVEQFVFDAARGRLTLWQKVEPFRQGQVVRKQLVLSGIRNGAAVAAVQQLLDVERCQRRWTELGYCVDWCGLDPAQPSRPPDLHLRLEIDHLSPLLVHCAKYRLQVLN